MSLQTQGPISFWRTARNPHRSLGDPERRQMRPRSDLFDWWPK